VAGESAPNGMWACAACTFQNGDDAGACDVCGQMRPVGVVLERQLEDRRAAREKARRRLARVKEGDNVLGPVMESFGCDQKQDMCLVQAKEGKGQGQSRRQRRQTVSLSFHQPLCPSLPTSSFTTRVVHNCSLLLPMG
jgi:hypothetical protein